ncbi:MAG: glycosyltransferase family A protein [Paludibacteraceae bacterium]|nr:glycosyltransferase family A protein [Paludibacteraceae bacterium]
MKFSVIIPLYNKAPYIRKALESVLAQTYTDYELIIVDDGSTDGSAEIAEAFLQELPASRLSPLAFRLLKQKNAGVSAARNNGFSVSSAEYLAFLDADDWWEPTYLERMAQLITDYPDAGLYACNYVYYKPGKTHVALNIPTGYINYPKAYYESNAMPVWTGAAMIPRKVYDEMGGFLLGIKLGEDFLLWSKIALRYPVAFLNEPLAWYNNDVPATLRATRNLHAPEYHMLFRLELAFCDEGENEVKGERLKAKGTKNSEADTPASRLIALSPHRLNSDWSRLLDKLRIHGLLEYWLSDEYHNQATQELSKVDWNQQPKSVKRMYKMPIWLLRMQRRVMQVGSWCKQLLIRR